MKKLLLWKNDDSKLKLIKQSALCDWLMTLFTFFTALGIFDVLYTHKYSKTFSAIKPVAHSKNIIAEIGQGGVLGGLDTTTGKSYTTGELTGAPGGRIVFGYVMLFIVILVLISLLFWKLNILTKQHQIEITSKKDYTPTNAHEREKTSLILRKSFERKKRSTRT